MTRHFQGGVAGARTFGFLAAAVCLLAAATVARAQVFTLWPSSGEIDKAGLAGLSGRHLFDEAIIVNGHRMTMGVSLHEDGISRLMSRLRPLPEGVRYSGDGGSVLLHIPLDDGRIRRILLVGVGGVLPVVQFAMTLPERLPRPVWPGQKIPMPPAATPTAVVELPGRGATSVMFGSPHPVEHVLADAAARLSADGWQAVPPPTSAGGRSGMFFYHPASNSVTLVGVLADSRGGSSGVYYQRRLGN